MIHFCPNLQYLRRELEWDRSLLEYLNLFEQGKIDLCDLLKIQEYIFLDTMCQQHQKNHDTNYILTEKLNEPLPWEEEDSL